MIHHTIVIWMTYLSLVNHTRDRLDWWIDVSRSDGVSDVGKGTFGISAISSLEELARPKCTRREG